MKIYFLTLLSIIVSLHVRAGSIGDKEAIASVLTKQQDAWNRGDMEGYMQGYWQSDSLIFVGSKGITYGWEATLENYKRSYTSSAEMGQLVFDIIKIEVFEGKEAFVLGKWALTRKAGNVDGYFSLRWRKINGDWKVVLDHSS